MARKERERESGGACTLHRETINTRVKRRKESEKVNGSGGGASESQADNMRWRLRSIQFNHIFESTQCVWKQSRNSSTQVSFATWQYITVLLNGPIGDDINISDGPPPTFVLVFQKKKKDLEEPSRNRLVIRNSKSKIIIGLVEHKTPPDRYPSRRSSQMT